MKQQLETSAKSLLGAGPARIPDDSVAPQAKPNAEQRAFAVWGELERGSASDAMSEASTVDNCILATATGDRAGFAELFHQVAPRVKAYLIHRGVDEGLAEDLSIETMVEVWCSARSFDPAAQSGRAWIYQRLRDVTDRNDVFLRTEPA